MFFCILTPRPVVKSLKKLKKINFVSKGDDYQILFTASKKKSRIIKRTFKSLGIKISKIGNIAGCMVKDGLVTRNSKIRLLRDNVVIHTGVLASLKRFKEEVKEVKNGFECGVMLENYSDIKIGDVIETFEEIKTERKL